MKSAPVLIITLIAGGAAVAFALIASQTQPEHDIVGGIDSNESLQFVFENATNLTNNFMDSVYGQVAAVNSSVYVIWQDSISGRNYDIFIKKSVDGGTTFGSHANLSNNSGFSEHPQLSANGSNVYAVWADNTPGNREILFARSVDNGTTFEDARNLSGDASDSYNQEIAAFESNVYITWVDNDKQGTTRILLRSSSDSGTTFNRKVEVSNQAGPGSFPKVAAFGRDIYLTWNIAGKGMDDGLYFAKSSDGGSTFDARKLDDNSGESQVAAYNGTVYVVAGGSDSAEVNGLLFFKSNDGGETFAEAVEIDAGGQFMNPLNVEVAADGKDVAYVAGQVLYGGNEEILLLPVSGDNATPLVNLSKNLKISECPSIAIAGNNIYVVWEDLTPGNHEVLYAKGSKT